MYFITTIEIKKGDVKDTRCVGYFKTFEEAEQAVIKNACDIWETCYDYAVIENIKEGLYQYDFHPTWYKYYKPTSGYIKCEQPDFVNPKGGVGMIGYAIGQEENMNRKGCVFQGFVPKEAIT